MASATLNGIVFDGLTVSECISIAREFSPAPIRDKHTEQVVRRATKRAKSNSDGEFTVEAHCGHMVKRNSPRGRKPALCDSCKSGSEGNSTKTPKTDAPKQKANYGRGRGRRGWQYSEDDSWRDQPASEDQLNRIQRGLKTRVMPNSQREQITIEIAGNITAGRASDIWREIRSLPSKGENNR